MLRVCEANLSDKLDVPVEYLKLDGNRIELASESVDVVTLNSVPHHIPDHSTFFDEIDRLMRAGGRLVICHEPNRRFYSHRLLWGLSRLTDRLLHPRKLVGAVLRKLGLDRFARRVPRDNDRETEHYREIAVEVNAQLVEEGLIDSPLTYLEMTEIVDIHSPTAGAGGCEGVGIDVAEITDRHLPNFDVVHLETYGHLQLSSHNRFTRWSDAALGRRFPELGSTLTVVLEKRPSREHTEVGEMPRAIGR